MGVRRKGNEGGSSEREGTTRCVRAGGLSVRKGVEEREAREGRKEGRKRGRKEGQRHTHKEMGLGECQASDSPAGLRAQAEKVGAERCSADDCKGRAWRARALQIGAWPCARSLCWPRGSSVPEPALSGSSADNRGTVGQDEQTRAEARTFRVRRRSRVNASRLDGGGTFSNCATQRS